MEAFQDGSPSRGMVGNSRAWKGLWDQSSNASSEVLSLRLDQPVENVEIVARTLLKDKYGALVSSTSRKMNFIWSKSTFRLNCSYSGCPNIRNKATLQCLLDGNVYCSSHCLGNRFSLFNSKFLDDSHFSLGRETIKQVIESEGAEGLSSRVNGFVQTDGWTAICNTKTYVPSTDDVGHLLMMECVAYAEDGSFSAKQKAVTQMVIGVSADYPNLTNRTFILSEEARKLLYKKNFNHLERYPKYSEDSMKHSYVKSILNNTGGAVVRVITYNLLADIYANPSMYWYCPQWALSFGYRKQLVLKELTKLDGDIVCLQECQKEHFDDWILPKMHELGYSAVFKAKTRESNGRAGNIDGVVILFKEKRLRLLSSHEIEFDGLVYESVRNGCFSSSDLSPQENERRAFLIASRLRRGTVGLVCEFETIPRRSGNGNQVSPASTSGTKTQRFFVATTHIFWDPELSDVKIWQTAKFFEQLSHIVGTDIPLVVAGDFNSTPDSAVVDYVCNGSVNRSHKDSRNDQFGISESVAGTHHNFNLKSAYMAVNGHEPSVTNYTENFSGVLDYIWYTDGIISPVAALEIPSETELRGKDDTWLPNSRFPSDHISLCVDVNICPKDRRVPIVSLSSPLIKSPGSKPPIEEFNSMHYYHHPRQTGYASQRNYG